MGYHICVVYSLDNFQHISNTRLKLNAPFMLDLSSKMTTYTYSNRKHVPILQAGQ